MNEEYTKEEIKEQETHARKVHRAACVFREELGNFFKALLKVITKEKDE